MVGSSDEERDEKELLPVPVSDPGPVPALLVGRPHSGRLKGSASGNVHEGPSPGNTRARDAETKAPDGKRGDQVLRDNEGEPCGAGSTASLKRLSKDSFFFHSRLKFCFAPLINRRDG
ncbi:hypothetical protein MLD38_019303 [Melastoma candidum]|uniref:Uncharacterized protein n=1 Tax=Melastoma candidum TaxID=119954 RepID=A0ACB9QVR3_9MYRT|nr:hypothetical protein MLD38_019303 [Melastoma candidum]